MIVFASLIFAAATPDFSFSGKSSAELSMSRCSEDMPLELRTFSTRNERFDVIDSYGEPLRVVKQTIYRKISGCTEGPEAATVDFEVTLQPRDGSKPGALVRFSAEGEDPTITGLYEWTLLRVTRYGCCGAQDAMRYFVPDDGRMVAEASIAPLPLQVINRVEGEGQQGSLWRYGFALGSTSLGFDNFAAENAGVIAELSWAGPDRPTSRYAVHLKAPAGAEVPGPWSITAMRWSGPALDEQGSSWWLDGEPPKAAQVDGMSWELELQCQCEAEPMKLVIPVKADALDITKARGPGLSLSAR